MEHQLRPPRGFVDIFNPFSLKNLESHTVFGLLLLTANQSLTENLGPNGRIGRRPQKLSTITN